jgi:hypothetical protein
MHGSGWPGTELIALVSTFVLTDAIAADDEAATHTSVWETGMGADAVPRERQPAQDEH